jgi:hypothetical protein
MAAHWMLIFTIGHRGSGILRAIAGFPLLPAQAQEPQKRTPVFYAHGCPRSGAFARPGPRHRRLLRPSAAGVRRAGPLDRKSCEPVDC